MIPFLRILFCVLACLLCCQMQNLINLSRENRVRQGVLVIVSILYAIAVPSLFALVLPAESLKSLQSQTGDILHAPLLLNFGLLIGFWPVKLSILGLLKKFGDHRGFEEAMSFGVYHYSSRGKFFALKEGWKDFRQMLKWVQISAALLCGLFLGIAWNTSWNSLIYGPLYLCALLPVLCALRNYFGGRTEGEYLVSIEGEQIASQRISNYARLREIYEKLLPKALLAAGSGFEMGSRSGSLQDLEKYRNSQNPAEKRLRSFFSAHDRFQNVSPSDLQAALDLMEHRNVVFFNPFYQDLGEVLILPMLQTLLDGQKVLVICGRQAMEEEALGWIRNEIARSTRMESIWRTGVLEDHPQDLEVGILTFSKIYDHQVLRKNQGFFADTGMVILLEPSRMLSTSQIALSIVAQSLGKDGQDPTWCVIDRECDGLLDTLSHVLKTEFILASAAPVPTSAYTVLFWDADGDYRRQQLFPGQVRALGEGMELAAIAMKNQIPSVSWVSESKVPLKDIRRIASQNYAPLCRYMNREVRPEKATEHIQFSTTLWSQKPQEEEFLIVEDEFCNMYSAVASYLSRGRVQSFVNVISENYLLRDYMKDNQAIFLHNTSAVPSMVPDYAKTWRNVLFKLIMLINIREVPEDEIRREFQLAGIETEDIEDTLIALLKTYTDAGEQVFTVQTRLENEGEFRERRISVYTISDEKFEEYFAQSLKNAFFIVEDELSGTEYLDARLYGQTVQTLLPGQFVTYNGKYYQVRKLNPVQGILLRRASDQYAGREYYRQLRRYTFLPESSHRVLSTRNFGKIRLVQEQVTLQSDTLGYLKLKDYASLSDAVPVLLSDDPNAEYYSRTLKNKTVLRLELPGMDAKTRQTLALLLNELFRSVFPDGWPYLGAVCASSNEDEALELMGRGYFARGSLDENSLYIVEDCEMDLGLLDAFEKNIDRFMEILFDYLDWHLEQMEPGVRSVQTEDIIFSQNLEYDLGLEEEERVSLWQRIKNWFGKFSRKSGKKNEEQEEESHG